MSVPATVILDTQKRVMIQVNTAVSRTKWGMIHKASERKVRNAAENLMRAKFPEFPLDDITALEMRWDSAPVMDSPLASPFVARRKDAMSQIVIFEN